MEPHGSQTYQTQPLDAGRREIRLLNLQPRTTDHIIATLSVADLASAAGTYACVSYVWGNPNETVPIEVDGHELQVTTNLFDLLHHIRDPNDILVLWADAICINQQDLEEKSHQVGMMGDIYSGCSLVHAWLGASSPPSSLEINPFTIFDHFADGKHWHDLPGILEEGDDEGEPSDAFVDQMAALRLVIDSPWWTRSWTVQEIILPGSTILWYGSYSTTWNRFSLTIGNKDASSVTCCTQGREMMESWPKVNQFNEFMSTIEMIDKLRRSRHQSTAASIGALASHEERVSFRSILLHFSNRQCKDPRDKVFSILGLAHGHMFDAYTPNYKQTLADCFTDIYRRLLEYDIDVSQVLLGRGFGPYNRGMPSWARDLSKEHDELMWEQTRARISNLYDCSAGSPGTVAVKDNKELHVKARKADTIRFVGKTHKLQDSDLSSSITVIYEWFKLASEVPTCTNGVLLCKDFIRTICATITQDVADQGQWRRCEDADLPSLETWLSFITGESYSFPYSFTSPMLLATKNRCLYITEAGSLGLCYPGTRPGDEVWALLGMNVPFVLRKASGKRQHEDIYHLMGDCFLLDQMDGGIMRNDEETKSIVLV
jgi:hypothetical protein